MAVYFKKPEFEHDWPKTFMHIGLAALEAAPALWGQAANLPNVTREAMAALQAKPKLTPVELAWVWLHASLHFAMQRLAKTAHPPSELNEVEVDKIVTALLERELTQLEGAEMIPAHFDSPANIPALEGVIASLPRFIAEIAPETPVDPAMLQQEFLVRMQEASGRVHAMAPDYYDALIRATDSALTKGEDRLRQWKRHEQWIFSRFHIDPIFSLDDLEDNVTVPLSHVYQRLRCFWHTDETLRARDARPRLGEPVRKRRTAHLAELHPTMHAWLKNDDGGYLRIVAGGPGSGKSSFARAFATEVVLDTPYRAIFIELQHFDFSEGVKNELAPHLTHEDMHSRISSEGSRGFRDNPMADRVSPILLIFDGLDELSAKGRVAQELTEKFIRSLDSYLREVNGEGPQVRALVLGRSTACGHALSVTEHPRETLIHVSSLRPLEGDADFALEDRTSEIVETQIKAPKGLRERDMRADYWRKWVALTGQDPAATPEAIRHDSLTDLNAEPLLLHLLILSGYASENWSDVVDNKNRVYQAIFQRIFARDSRKQNAGDRSWSEEEAFALLECFGLAAWRGGMRTASTDDFDDILKLYAPEIAEDTTDGDRISLWNVAIQIHARQGVSDGYEFIHKSFAEYLVARGLLNAALTMAGMRQGKRRSSEQVTTAFWADLVRNSELTVEVIGYLVREARLLNTDEAASARPVLEALFSWVQRSGMPVLHGGAETFRDAETRQRCAETALLAVLSALAQAAPDAGDGAPARVGVDWPDPMTSPRHMIARLWRSPAPPVRLSLSRLVMPDAWLETIHLRGADLSRADLSGADLSRADLSRADLSGADLNGADLNGAHLSGADLSGADLSRAHLIGANLIGANLNGAHLSGAHLSGAKLFEAKLFEADLSGANLNGANLFGANLFGAKLSGAKLSRADLSGADLSGAKLSGADLSGADLSGAKLSGADLSGADLSGADLSGADLSGANLSRADCRRLDIDLARLQSADFSKAKHLTQEQVNVAYGDSETKLPKGLKPTFRSDDD